MSVTASRRQPTGAVPNTAGKALHGQPELSRPTSRLGSGESSYGVWLEPLHADSVVYSVGVGDDISFDRALIEAAGACVHAFDPTPHAIEWLRSRPVPEAFRFDAVGLAAHDGSAAFHLPADPRRDISAAMDACPTTSSETVTLPVRRLGTLMATRGHAHVDVLKMDVEGAEYDVLDDVLAVGLDVRQILVRVHHGRGTDEARRRAVERTRRLLHQMRAAGYGLYDVSEGAQTYSFAQADLGGASARTSLRRQRAPAENGATGQRGTRF